MVTVIPEFGGKIASIQIGGLELLQPPLSPIAPRTQTMAFDDADASGWDECLPSVAACVAETNAGAAQIPDHGDLWRVEWEKQGPATSANKDGSPATRAGIREQGLGRDAKTESSLTLLGECFSLPLELERTLALSETARGWRLSLDYLLKNTGQYSVPWSWAAHPLFVAEKGDRIELPKSIRSLRLEGSGGDRLGRSGDTVSWPVATLADGSVDDLSVGKDSASEVGDKLFAGPLSAAENWCALERPSTGLRIRVRFDAAATPYLGLWICYGGWPEKSGPKQVCVAMEPATAPVDSLAVRGPWSRTLAPAETFSWPMEVEIERTER